jgi:virginiamycin B lyase
MAGAAAITEFGLPPGSAPHAITAGPDGALWFTEINGNKIVRITTAGDITEFPLPTADSQPSAITAGPDGALWFTEYNGYKIGRITTAGVITEFPLPTADSRPNDITSGPDGALWFTESRSYLSDNRIGRITTAGTITEFHLPIDNNPSNITAGPDEALWFIGYGNKIGRFTTSGALSEFLVPTPRGSYASRITAGPDGALWFTHGNEVGRITTAGGITEFAIPTAYSNPYHITAGPDGALWFTELDGNKIGRITTAGGITEFPLPTAYSRPSNITVGPDGALWFILRGDPSRIGRIPPDLVGIAEVSLNASLFHTGQTLTYQATLTPGSTPTQVDIYLGAIPPDGTFVSFKEMSPGVISATADSSPVPFLANVPLTQEFVPFSYTFTGAEPVGAYLMYAALVIPGRNPLFPENQLDVAVKSFQFSSDVCLSVSVGTGGWDTISPPGTYRGPTCPRAFAPGTTVTVTVQSIYQWPIRDDFLGWGEIARRSEPEITTGTGAAL